MRVLHLASFDRWTGAAAPAWAEVEALRAAGVEAHYGYIGGNNLEKRIGGSDFAHAVLRKGHMPAAMIHSIRALRALLERERFEIVHAHLSHDHWLSSLAIRRNNVPLVRTFHARRALRRDPLTSRLFAATDGICVVNEEFVWHPALRGRDALWTAPPLDPRQFSPAGADARALHGI
ncbi:MAG TPA: glycosyltransferase, partial [Thermoanaerobaculia bacterium]